MTRSDTTRHDSQWHGVTRQWCSHKSCLAMTGTSHDSLTATRHDRGATWLFFLRVTSATLCNTLAHITTDMSVTHVNESCRTYVWHTYVCRDMCESVMSYICLSWYVRECHVIHMYYMTHPHACVHERDTTHLHACAQVRHTYRHTYIRHDSFTCVCIHIYDMTHLHVCVQVCDTTHLHECAYVQHTYRQLPRIYKNHTLSHTLIK